MIKSLNTHLNLNQNISKHYDYNEQYLYNPCLCWQRQKQEEESRKQQEIEGLQKQLQQLKDMASGKAVSNITLIRGW